MGMESPHLLRKCSGCGRRAGEPTDDECLVCQSDEDWCELEPSLAGWWIDRPERAWLSRAPQERLTRLRACSTAPLSIRAIDLFSRVEAKVRAFDRRASRTVNT